MNNKRLLIVRYPSGMHPDAIELSYNKTKERAGDDFLVLPFVENVERVEVEIVYDPHSMSQSGPAETLCGSFERGNDRQFAQVDTSTNAYMDGNGVAAMAMQEERIKNDAFPDGKYGPSIKKCFGEGSLSR